MKCEAVMQRKDEAQQGDMGAHRHSVAPRGCDNEPTSQKVGALTAFSSFPSNGECLYCGRYGGLPDNACRFTQFAPRGADNFTIRTPLAATSLDLARLVAKT